MAIDTDTLKAELVRLMEAGDEKALERFALDHFTEFPKDVQGDILLSFVSETLEKQAGQTKIADLQKRGIEALEKLAALKAALPAEATQSE